MPTISATFTTPSIVAAIVPKQQTMVAAKLATTITTPTTTGVQHVKLHQQHSLPLQLHYNNRQSTSSLFSTQQQQITTTQPSPAGTFICQTAGIINSSIHSGLMMSTNSNGGDISPISSTGSFSSADTNQTLLNAIINHQQQQQQQQQHQQQQSLPATPINSNRTNNRSFRTKYGQFMIITPAVSIDRDFIYQTSTVNGVSNENGVTTSTATTLSANAVTTTTSNNVNGRRNTKSTTTTVTTTSTISTTATIATIIPTLTTTNANGTTYIKDIENTLNDNDIDDMSAYFNNGNIFRMSLLQGSIDSGCSSDSSSFRSNYNPYLHTSRAHLLPKSTPQNFYTFSSWRWCTLICAAMRCFGAGHSTHTSYSSSFARPPYQRTRSHGYTTTTTNAKTPHRRLRPSTSFTAETAFEHFSAPFTPRKTRDHLNNITYEL